MFLMKGRNIMKKSHKIISILLLGIPQIKSICIVLLLFCSLTLVSCQNNDYKIEKSATTTMQEDVVDNSKKVIDNYSISFVNAVKESGDYTKSAWLPCIKFSEENEENAKAEEQINKILEDAAMDWMTDDFIRSPHKREIPEIYCHNDRYFSIGLSWFHSQRNYARIQIYITIDLMQKKRVFLHDIVENTEELISKMHTGTGIQVEGFMKQDNDDKGTYLCEIPQSELSDMLEQCSEDEKEFAKKHQKEEGFSYMAEKCGFYLFGNKLVIDDGKRDHVKIIFNDLFLQTPKLH